MAIRRFLPYKGTFKCESFPLYWWIRGWQDINDKFNGFISLGRQVEGPSQVYISQGRRRHQTSPSILCAPKTRSLQFACGPHRHTWLRWWSREVRNLIIVDHIVSKIHQITTICHLPGDQCQIKDAVINAAKLRRMQPLIVLWSKCSRKHDGCVYTLFIGLDEDHFWNTNWSILLIEVR